MRKPMAITCNEAPSKLISSISISRRSCASAQQWHNQDMKNSLVVSLAASYQLNTPARPKHGRRRPGSHKRHIRHELFYPHLGRSASTRKKLEATSIFRVDHAGTKGGTEACQKVCQNTSVRPSKSTHEGNSQKCSRTSQSSSHVDRPVLFHESRCSCCQAFGNI